MATGPSRALALLCFSPPDIRNALSLALFQQRLTPPEVQAVWLEVENDSAAGLLCECGGLWHRVLATAQAFSQNQTPAIGCRTLDVLHVASAKLIGVTEFCTFDTRQSTLAGQIGLVAITP